MRTAQTSAIDHSSVPGLTMPAGSGLARTCGNEMHVMRRNTGPCHAAMAAAPGNPHHTLPLFENRLCGAHKAWGPYCRFCVFGFSFLPRRAGRRTENHFTPGTKAGDLTRLTPTYRSQRSCRSCRWNPGRRRHTSRRPNRQRTRSSDGPSWRSRECRASGRCS